MPITQERLMALISIYDLRAERDDLLIEQNKSIQHAAMIAYQTNNLDELWQLIQSLNIYIEEATKVRRKEHQIFAMEKAYFETNARRNYRNRALMTQLRETRRAIKDGTLQLNKTEAQGAEQVLMHTPKAQPYFKTLPDNRAVSKEAAELYSTLTNKIIDEGCDPLTFELTLETMAWIGQTPKDIIDNQLIPYLLEQGLLKKQSEDCFILAHPNTKPEPTGPIVTSTHGSPELDEDAAKLNRC